MSDIICAILNTNAHFDKKGQINILGKFMFGSNARDITLYCEFSNAVFRHAIRMLPGMKKKTQSYICTWGSGNLLAQRVLQMNMEIDLLFSYCHERPSDWTIGYKVLHVPSESGIFIDMYYWRKFLFDQQTLLKSSWHFPK